LTIAEAARRYAVSEQSISAWRRRFLEYGRAGLSRTGDAAHRAQLQREREELKSILRDAKVEMRVWEMSAKYAASLRSHG
jgi:transposase